MNATAKVTEATLAAQAANKLECYLKSNCTIVGYLAQAETLLDDYCLMFDAIDHDVCQFVGTSDYAEIMATIDYLRS